MKRGGSKRIGEHFLLAWQIQRFIRLSKKKKNSFFRIKASESSTNILLDRKLVGRWTEGRGGIFNYSVIVCPPTVRWAYRRSRTRYLSTHERNVKETCAGGYVTLSTCSKFLFFVRERKVKFRVLGDRRGERLLRSRGTKATNASLKRLHACLTRGDGNRDRSDIRSITLFSQRYVYGTRYAIGSYLAWPGKQGKHVAKMEGGSWDE